MEEKRSLDERLRLCGVRFFRQEYSWAIVAIIGAVLVLVVTNLVLQASDNARTIADQQAIIQEMIRQEQRLDENGVRIDRMREYYGRENWSYLDGTVRFQNDAEFREYCQKHYPEAVYPSTEWTAEEVIQSYYDTPEIWALHETGPFIGEYLTWTPGYEHCFILEVDAPAIEWQGYTEITSGWLVVDGVRVQPLDKVLYDLDNSIYWPQSLLIRYNKGEWDGSLMRSQDGATTVRVNQNGALGYAYDAWFYDETTDPEGLAWAGFNRDKVPWWRNGIEWTASDLVQPQLEALGEWDPSGDHVYEQLSTCIYTDAPYMTDGNQFTRVLRTEEGLFAMSPGVIRFYSGGKELEKWVCTGTAAPGAYLFEAVGEPEEEYAENLAYFYDGETLRALRADDQMAVVMDEILKYSDPLLRYFWGLKDGRLVYYNASGAGKITTIAEDVLETDFSTVHLFRKADGWYVAAAKRRGGADYEAVYLGEGEKEEYLEAYNLLRRATG